MYKSQHTAGIISLLIASTAWAAPQGKQQPDTRPAMDRVEAIAAMLPAQPTGLGKPITDRDTWGKLAGHKAFRQVVRNAEKHLTSEIPPLPDELYLEFSRNGNRTNYQKVNSIRLQRFNDLVLAECLEGKGRFLPAIQALIAAFGEQKSWLLPAHDRSLATFKGTGMDVDLNSSAQGWTMATAAWLLGDVLPPASRELLNTEVRRRVLDPCREAVEGRRQGSFWMKATHNWNSVCWAGVTGAALALLESREERAFFAAAAEQNTRLFLSGFTSDGYCSEGLAYWNYGFGHYVMLAETLHQATGGKVDLLDRPEVQPAANFPVGLEMAPDLYPPFADCNPRTKPTPSVMHYLNRRLDLGLKKWEQPDTASPSGALFQVMINSFPNAASHAKPSTLKSDGPGLRSWFDQAGILIARPAPGGTSRMSVALKGGHNAEHHNHNDLGSFVVALDSTAVLVDPGSEVYTARTFSGRRYDSKVLNSYGHSVPVVGGKLQRPGAQAQAKLLKNDFTDSADSLAFDLTSAYQVAGLVKLTRDFEYSRKGRGALAVTDTVEFNEPQTFGGALVTFGEVKQLDAHTIVVSSGSAAVRVEIASSAGEPVIKTEEIVEDLPGNLKPTRIGIDLAKPVKAAKLTLTIVPQ